MVHPMRAKFGLSLSNRAVLLGWATLDDLIDAAQRAEASCPECGRRYRLKGDAVEPSLEPAAQEVG